MYMYSHLTMLFIEGNGLSALTCLRLQVNELF